MIWLAFVGIFSFVISIVFTTSNYIVSDNGIELASKSNSARRMQHDKMLHRVNRLKREIEKLKPEDEKNIDAAREQCWNDVEKFTQNEILEKKSKI